MLPNSGLLTCPNGSQAPDTGVGKKGKRFIQVSTSREDGGFFQSSKTHLQISVQTEVFMRARESKTRSAEGAVDMQAVSLLVRIWILMVSVHELAIWLNSCIWAVCVSQGLEGQAAP